MRRDADPGAGPEAPDGSDLLLDPGALRRRVLLAAAATFAAYLLAAYVLSVLDAPPWLLLPALVLVVVLVVRPLMRPVFAANRLRKALAYQAFLDGRSGDGRNGDGSRG